MIAHVWGVQEFAILNTCNRVELIAVVNQSAVVERVLCRLLRFDQLPTHDFYCKSGRDAFSHLALVSAGLLSQTPGENHIVAQVKQAVADAVELGWAGAMMQQWLSQALHLSKHIRAEVAPILHAREIESLALDYLMAHLDSAQGKRLVVLGTGVVGRSLVKRAVHCGYLVSWCFHRNKPELDGLGDAAVNVADMTAMPELLAEADAVVCATASDQYVIDQGHAACFDSCRKTFVVDLAMPRNVAPELGLVGSTVRVADLDDLKHWFRRKCADMQRIFEISTAVIEDHSDLFEKLLAAFPDSDG
jgi:glutamyl-tRNA reductase